MEKSKKISLFIILFGVFFVILGVCQNEYHDTLMKAILICLECIGIG